MLAAALRRHTRHRALENLEQRLLHTFARDVARNAGVFRLARDLVDLVDIADAPLGLGYVEIGGLQQAYEDVLDIFTDVARFGQRGGVGDREWHVQNAGQRLGQQRLAYTRRADQQDVALVELDLVVAARMGVDALVMVVDGDGEGLFGAVLPDHVLVQHVLDLGGRGDLRDRFCGLAAFRLCPNLNPKWKAIDAHGERTDGNRCS